MAATRKAKPSKQIETKAATTGEELQRLADDVERVLAHVEAVGLDRYAKARMRQIEAEQVGPLIEEVNTFWMVMPDGEVIRTRTTIQEGDGPETAFGDRPELNKMTDGAGNVIVDGDFYLERARVLELLDGLRLLLLGRARTFGGLTRFERMRRILRELCEKPDARGGTGREAEKAPDGGDGNGQVGSGNNGPDGLSDEARALAAYVEDPTQSMTTLAKKVGVHRQRLYDMRRLCAAREAHEHNERASRLNAKPGGEKDGETGTIEAWTRRDNEVSRQ